MEVPSPEAITVTLTLSAEAVVHKVWKSASDVLITKTCSASPPKYFTEFFSVTLLSLSQNVIKYFEVGKLVQYLLYEVFFTL
jgi:hypothetical protein